MNYNDFLIQIRKIKETNIKPKLLLHSCCGPCSTHVLKLLSEVFDITIFFYNPNIYPSDEFKKRLIEQEKVVKHINEDIKIIEGFYDYNLYLNEIKGLEQLGERSKRCYNCYEFRLKETYEYAKNNGFDYYTTTLSISPYKNSTWINEIMEKYQTDDCKYLYSNFKKEEGYKKSIEYSKEYDLYRQDYCGCEFSKLEHLEILKKKSI